MKWLWDGEPYILQGETSVAISEDEASQKVFRYLADALKNTSVTLKRVSQTEPGDICFLTDSLLPDEAYTLDVSSGGIKISSNETAAGLFYAIQSLLQLMRRRFIMPAGSMMER